MATGLLCNMHAVTGDPVIAQPRRLARNTARNHPRPVLFLRLTLHRLKVFLGSWGSRRALVISIPCNRPNCIYSNRPHCGLCSHSMTEARNAEREMFEKMCQVGLSRSLTGGGRGLVRPTLRPQRHENGNLRGTPSDPSGQRSEWESLSICHFSAVS